MIEAHLRKCVYNSLVNYKYTYVDSASKNILIVEIVLVRMYQSRLLVYVLLYAITSYTSKAVFT